MTKEDQNRKKTNNPKTYQVRKECIKRKTMELSTLCDIPVCTIITGPQGELQTWPENLDAVKEVLNLYTQNLKPEKKAKELSASEEEEKDKDEEEQEGEKDILTLVESKLDAVNKRICFLKDKNNAAGAACKSLTNVEIKTHVVTELETILDSRRANPLEVSTWAARPLLDYAQWKS
ncbi:hypothetical protein K7X08_009131 [Anisodus acutangulus]|uniref:MADS-box domain-containing protein n=1 Tax=Anisodus acutangulus TaxID=402998 RepID=A0A9Q1N2M3_9SOLA|nr:hypothetical protein K7X08_009131 [Anisodus acutangulus]